MMQGSTDFGAVAGYDVMSTGAVAGWLDGSTGRNTFVFLAATGLGLINHSLTLWADPRIGQVHAKLMPEVTANEAKRRGVQQGVIIEEA